MPELTPQEQGYEGPMPPKPDHLPAGGSKWLAPQMWQTISMLGQYGKAYWWSHDEALRDSQCNADAMWADSVISTAVRERQRPVTQLGWQLEARNPTSPTEKAMVERVTEILEDIPYFQQFRRSLLDAIWWGRAGVQCAFSWNMDAGDKRMVIRDWMPVHGDSIVFKFDGTAGIRVNSMMSGQPGVVALSDGLGFHAKFPNADEAQTFFVHQFEPEAASFFQPDLIGSVKGSGYRGRVYWYWWLKHNMQRLAYNFARKAGNGFFLAGYEAGNRTELTNLQTALESQDGQPIIYVPLNAERDPAKVLNHIQVGLQGADFQWKIVEALNQLIRDAILGETNANGPAPTGIGGSNAEQRGMSDDERVKYDAIDLETPLQKVVNVIYRYVDPSVRPARFQHLIDKRNPEEYIQAAQFFMTAGGVVDENEMRSELGLKKPNEGDPVISLVGAQQATALGTVPGGVPMEGQPGPAPGGPQDAGQQPQQGGDDQQLAQQIQPMPTP